MDQILTDISSIYWWISVVVIGILINVTAAFFIAPIRKFFGYFSKAIREHNERTQAKREEWIEYLVNHPEDITAEEFRAIRIGHSSIMGWILAGIFAIMYMETAYYVKYFLAIIPPDDLLLMQRLLAFFILGELICFIGLAYLSFRYNRTRNEIVKARHRIKYSREENEQGDNSLQTEQ